MSKDNTPIKEKIVLRPSGLSTFISNPREWYNNTILKKYDFNGSVNTVRGSVIHLLFEHTTLKTSRSDLDLLIAELLDLELDDNVITKEEYDEIMAIIPKALEEVELILSTDHCKILAVEHNVNTPLVITDTAEYLGKGSIDALVQDKATGELGIRDYKTSSKKPRIDNYRLQLLYYAYIVEIIYKKPVKFIEVIGLWITPKNQEVKSVVIREEINPKNMDFVKEVLKDAIDTLIISKHQPELTNLLFRKGTAFMGKIEYPYTEFNTSSYSIEK